MKKNSRVSLWTLVIATVVCLLGRVYQIVGCTDMTTGFLYYEDGALAGLVYYLPLVLSFVALVLSCDRDRNHGRLCLVDTDDVVDARAAAIGFGMLLTGIGAAYCGIEKMSSDYASAFSTYVDLLFGGAMIVIAFITLYQKEFSAGLGFSYVVGAVYFTLRGVLVFLERMVIVTVPEYLINALTAVSAGIFFMLFAKHFSGNGQKRTRTALCIWGGFTAVLSLSSSLAVILAKLTAPVVVAERIVLNRNIADAYYQYNGGRDAYLMAFTPWVDFAVGIMAAAVVATLVLGEKKLETENEQIEG